VAEDAKPLSEPAHGVAASPPVPPSSLAAPSPVSRETAIDRAFDTAGVPVGPPSEPYMEPTPAANPGRPVDPAWTAPAHGGSDGHAPDAAAGGVAPPAGAAVRDSAPTDLAEGDGDFLIPDAGFQTESMIPWWMQEGGMPDQAGAVQSHGPRAGNSGTREPDHNA
jgi:hypothetical protein